MPNSLKILFLAAEADPLVKIGGLGDVAGSLPAALGALPESPDVRLVLPLYPRTKNAAWDLKPVATFNISHSRGPVLAEIFQTTINTARVRSDCHPDILGLNSPNRVTRNWPLKSQRA